MYKNILIAVDGSDTSDLALTEAIRLAKEQHAHLRLIHVVDEAPAYTLTDAAFPISEYQKTMREAGKNVREKCAAKASDSGVVFDTQCPLIDSLVQRICDVISQEAIQWPADLIVIGTHGRHGFDRLLLGSVAEGVIRIATKPVLIIRGGP